MKLKRGSFWGVAIAFGAALVLVIVVLFLLRRVRETSTELPVYGVVPIFEFTESDGMPFGRDEMAGKVCVVDFIFTRCPGICPVMAAAMSDFYRVFQDNDGVRFVSISVDPDYDTPEILSQYARDHGVTDDRWVFLNGPLEKVIELSENGFMLPAEDLPSGHSSRFILVDQKGRIRGYFDSQDAASLKILEEHILVLLRSDS